MSRPIKLTPALLERVQKEFIESLSKQKMFDGTIKYEQKFKWEADGGIAHVVFTPAAFAKMTMLVQKFDTEIAWHGVVTRSEADPTVFTISDIIVYPQVVSGSTVNTDQEEYTKWLFGLDDDTFNNLKMQGHSHVSFSTSPSAVDLTHQSKILEQVEDGMFYIFMIWNKKYEHNIKIYDMRNNTLYEDDDIAVSVGDDDLDLDAFIKESRDAVKVQYQTPGYQSGYQKRDQSGYNAPVASIAAGKVKPKETAAAGNAWGDYMSRYRY